MAIPRSISQAKNLNSLLNDSNQKIDFIFFLNVNKDTIIKRIEKRKILEKRSDDDLDTILKRYDTYMKQLNQCLDFTQKIQIFMRLMGVKKLSQITTKIEAFLNV